MANPTQILPVAPAKAPNEPAPEATKEQPKQGLWLNEEQLLEVKENIEAGLAYQKAEGRLDKWEKNQDYVNCRWDSTYDDDDNEGHCNVNMLYSNVQAEVPALYFQQPDVSTFATRPTFTREIKRPDGTVYQVEVDNYQAAKLLQVRLNQIIKDSVIEPTIERSIVHCKAPYGHAWFKVGYGFTSEFERNLQQEVTRTTYWIANCDPRNIVFDPLAAEINKRCFTAERLIRRKKQLENNPLYLKDKVSKLPTKVPDTLKRRLESLNSKYDPKVLEIWEYHDHDAKTVHWLSIDGTPVEVREPIKESAWVEGSVYIFMDLNIATDDTPYTLSDVEPVLDQAIARNKIRTAQMRMVESWGITIFVEDSFWKDEESEDRWSRGGNGTMICKVKAGSLNQNKMQVVPPPSIPPDWYSMDRVYKQDNDETLAITAAQRGQTTGATKAEVMTVNNASNVLIARQRRKIKLAILEIVKKLASLVREHDDVKTMIDLTNYTEDQELMAFLRDHYGFDPSVPFLQVDKTAWQGEYRFDYDVEEQLDRPKSVQLAQLIQTTTQFSTVPMFASVMQDETDAKTIIGKAYELQGIHLESLKKRKALPDLPAELENDMAENGVEIPDPSEKNDDDRHIFTHLTLEREMSAKLPKMVAIAQSGAQEAIDAVQQMQGAIKRLQSHAVKHNVQKQKKEGRQAMLQGKPSPVNGPDVMRGAQPAQEAQVPDQVTINQNAGV